MRQVLIGFRANPQTCIPMCSGGKEMRLRFCDFMDFLYFHKSRVATRKAHLRAARNPYQNLSRLQRGRGLGRKISKRALFCQNGNSGTRNAFLGRIHTFCILFGPFDAGGANMAVGNGFLMILAALSAKIHFLTQKVTFLQF